MIIDMRHICISPASRFSTPPRGLFLSFVRRSSATVDSPDPAEAAQRRAGDEAASAFHDFAAARLPAHGSFRVMADVAASGRKRLTQRARRARAGFAYQHDGLPGGQKVGIETRQWLIDGAGNVAGGIFLRLANVDEDAGAAFQLRRKGVAPDCCRVWVCSAVGE
jgi:hypothetical protein